MESRDTKANHVRNSIDDRLGVRRKGGEGGQRRMGKQWFAVIYCFYATILPIRKASTEASTKICRWQNLTKEDKISRETMESQWRGNQMK